MTSLSQICATIVSWLADSQPQNPKWSPEIWQTFQFVCRVHGVAPLLHETLRASEWLDATTKIWLAEQFDLNRRRVAKMQAELRDILVLFGQRQIPVMPLKGSILSVELYEMAGWRPMADLDLLIHPRDFTRSAPLLRQLGYEQEVVHWKHTEFIKTNNRRIVSTTGEHPDNPRGVEVHLYCRETFGGPTIELTDLMWANAEPGTLLGAGAVLAKPDALWLHLVVHNTYHLWQGRGRLIHLLDLARLTPRLVEPAVYLNAVEARFTYPSLVMLNKYFPTVLDQQILIAQQERVSASFQAWTKTLDLVNTSYLSPNPAGLYLLKALKFTEGRPGEVLQALRFALLPSLEEIALDHPRLATSPFPWLGYFLLPLDWLKRLREPTANRHR